MEYEKVRSSPSPSIQTDEICCLTRVLRELLGDQRCRSGLDIGAGTGDVTDLLYQRCDHLTLVEPVPEFCSELRQRFSGAEVHAGRLQTSSFPDETFDIILASHVLYYVELADWLLQLERCWDWLSPGGQLVLVLNSEKSDWYRTVKELSNLLGIVPGFSYIAPEQFFRHFRGGATDLRQYDSTVSFQGDRAALVAALVETLLYIPGQLLSPAQWKQTAEFVDHEMRRMSGSYTQRNAAIVGCWRKSS
jgi:SAM-dependent methyltransferase